MTQAHSDRSIRCERSRALDRPCDLTDWAKKTINVRPGKALGIVDHLHIVWDGLLAGMVKFMFPTSQHGPKPRHDLPGTSIFTSIDLLFNHPWLDRRSGLPVPNKTGRVWELGSKNLNQQSQRGTCIPMIRPMSPHPQYAVTM